MKQKKQDLKISKRVKNLKGQKFGKLKVIIFAGYSPTRKAKWRCLCECGRTTVVFACNLVKGHTSSCGCAYKGCQVKDIVGQRFKKLTVVRFGGKTPKNGTLWYCRCDCGNYVTYRLCDLLGKTVSCGCHRRSLRPGGKLTEGQATQILRQKGKGDPKVLAGEFKIHITSVYNIWRGKTWPHLSG